MNALTKIAPKLLAGNPPDVLRKLPGWLTWKYEWLPGEPKPRKVPYYTAGGRRHGKQGRPEERQWLTGFDEALGSALKRGHDGVGLALLPEFGLVALDFDDCIVEGGVHPDVERIVAGTYAEYSPSGKGVRAFMLGNLGNKKSKDSPFGFETFSSKGFVTFTGNRLEITDMLGTENTITPVNAPARELWERRFETKPPRALDDLERADPVVAGQQREGLTDKHLKDCLEVLDPDMPHDPWLNVGMALHHETEGERFDLWDEWSSAGAAYPGSEELWKRWESFGQHTGNPVTAKTLLKMARDNGASIDDFDIVGAELAQYGADPFLPIPAAEFVNGKAPAWLIKGVLPEAELVVVFGESGSGKSFLALDMAACVARGVEWRDRRVKQGRVVYIAAEGAGGFRNRLKAYAQHHQVDLAGLPFSVIQAAPNLLERKDAARLSKAIGEAALVIVDTFAQTTAGGDENSAKDVGKALGHCRAIHRATGAVVVLVHHSGKNADRGARGWSGLRAAADAELEVTRAQDARVVSITKQKDGHDGEEFGFRLENVRLGEDEDGKEITSCVVEHCDVLPKAVRRRAPKGANEQIVMRVLADLISLQEEAPSHDEVLQSAIAQVTPPEDGKKDNRRGNMSRAIDSLVAKGLISVDGARLSPNGG